MKRPDDESILAAILLVAHVQANWANRINDFEQACNNCQTFPDEALHDLSPQQLDLFTTEVSEIMGQLELLADEEVYWVGRLDTALKRWLELVKLNREHPPE